MRYLIAGLGSIGRRHLHNLIALGHQDIYLYRSGHSSAKPGEEFAEFPVEFDLEKALAHKPQAVIISNPTALHLDVAIPAAEAGCDLFLEKPISHSIDRISDLETALTRGGGKFLMGFQFRFHPGLKRIKKILEENRIGKVLFVCCHWGEFLPGWHPNEDYRKGYSARNDLGGGVVLTLCHPIDYLRWFLGEISNVFAITGKMSDLEINVDDYAEILLKTKGGALISLHLDYIQQPPQHFLEITGTDGIIKWDNSDGSVHLYKNSIHKWQQYPIERGFERNSMFLEEMRHFVEVVEGRSQSLCNLQDGLAVQKIIAAIDESSKTGNIIPI